jgi:hypothetical protein
VHRDPRELSNDEDSEDARRSVGRAWGIVLGAWVALFAFLAFVVTPLLFSVCEANR